MHNSWIIKTTLKIRYWGSLQKMCPIKMSLSILEVYKDKDQNKRMYFCPTRICLSHDNHTKEVLHITDYTLQFIMHTQLYTLLFEVQRWTLVIHVCEHTAI